MAEDIDIEEHDLLQNPTIKRIFPDLSILKQEIIDFDEGLPEDVYSVETDNSNFISECLSFPNYLHSKIKIGSITSKTTTNLHLEKEVKVKLRNIRPYLLRTKRFCNQCCILFPNKHSFNNHKLNIHTNLNCRFNKYRSIYFGKSKKYKCALCPAQYIHIRYLRRHEKSYHSIQRSCKEITAKNQINLGNVTKPFDLQTNYVSGFCKPCSHCDKQFPNEQDLIDHLYTILYAKKVQPQVTFKNLEHNISTQEDTMRHIGNVILQNDIGKAKKIYSCPLCSYYFLEKHFCRNHVIVKHKATNMTQIDESAFNSMCKFCEVRLDNIFSYNDHLRKSHKNEMLKDDHNVQSINNEASQRNSNNLSLLNESNEKISVLAQDEFRINLIHNVRVMVLKIILYVCSECKLYFLTRDAAFKHFEHATMLENWLCENCYRIFKEKDALIHQKQHKCSNYFEVIKVFSKFSVQPVKLYKCTMCAVHFNKDKIYEHCNICEHDETRSTESSYCRVCDIFIETSIKSKHDDDHNLKKYTPADFEIVDSEIPILNDDNENYKKTGTISQKLKSPLPGLRTADIEKHSNARFDDKLYGVTNISKSLFEISAKKNLSYNYCSVCKCNISRVHKMGVHLKSLCVDIVKYMCKHCGLMFTNKSIIAHKKLHQRYNTLKLQDFTFYCLQTRKMMKPLIPLFPKCEFCETQFISKIEVKRHLCDVNDYTICATCQNKFSGTTYKLHLAFHKYILKGESHTSNELIDKVNSLLNQSKINGSILSTPDTISVIYTCRNCNLSMNTYDEIVEHCHLHTNLNKVEVNGVECITCLLKFSNSSYNKHVEIHNDNKYVKLTRFQFDVLYFGSDNRKWFKHIYRSLSKYDINKLTHNSIYKYETRIKMAIVQEGPSHITVYKCGKCRCIVDCHSTYSHIATCCPNSEISECTFCDLSFVCSITRNNHEKIHAMSNITMKSYRIVMFNREQDRNINCNISNFKKCYVVFECRNCHVLVESYNYMYHICFINNYKKCNVCGLLVVIENLDDHILKHKLLSSFNVSKIKVILLGNKIEDYSALQKNIDLVPTFNGIVCDYTFYKCINCEVCVRDVRNTIHHKCLIDAAKSQCMKCDLIFDEGKLKGHLKLHDTDLDFTKETILVKPFSNRKLLKTVDKPKKLPIEIETGDQIRNQNLKNIIHVKTAKLYKCLCGLYYIHESLLQDHMKKCSGKIKTKQIQSCSKCGFLFTSDVLFKHILEHHGDKSVVFKYEIVEDSRKVESA